MKVKYENELTINKNMQLHSTFSAEYQVHSNFQKRSQREATNKEVHYLGDSKSSSKNSLGLAYV